MVSQANPNERLLKFLQAPPEIQTEIDRILDGKGPTKVEPPAGPMFCCMSTAARFLGISRATLWRMIKAGRLEAVEILPGSSRIRWTDLQAIVTRKGGAQ